MRAALIYALTERLQPTPLSLRHSEQAEGCIPAPLQHPLVSQFSRCTSHAESQRSFTPMAEAAGVWVPSAVRGKCG